MTDLSNKLRQYLWFAHKDTVLFEGKGLYSAVKVTKRGDRVNLYTGGKFLQTSWNPYVIPGGGYFDWYLVAPWFSGKFKGNIGSMLILGLGGGSQVHLYNRVYNVKQITGVEIDPLIIDLGKKYFDLNLPNLKVFKEDSSNYLKTTSERYDVIVLDSFKENMFDEHCQTKDYLKSTKEHMTNDGVLLINRVLTDPYNQKMGSELKKVFNTVITLRIHKSMFFIATNSDNAPLDVNATNQLMKKASQLHQDLKFLKKYSKKNITHF